MNILLRVINYLSFVVIIFFEKYKSINLGGEMKPVRWLLCFLIPLLFVANNIIAQNRNDDDSRQMIKNHSPINNTVFNKSALTDQWNNVGPKGLITNAAVVDPQNSSRIIAGSVAGLFITTDGGQNWSIVNSSFYNMNIYGLKMHPTNRNIILATVYSPAADISSIYRSTDAGTTWAKVIDMYDMNGGKIVFAPSSPDVVFIEGYYLYKSINAGATWSTVWSNVSSDNDIYTFDVSKTNANKLFLECYNKDLYSSDDGGLTYTKITTLTNRLKELVVSPASNTILYGGSQDRQASGGYGFFTSIDGGTTWGTNKTGFGTFSKVSFITFHPDNSNILYCGGSGTGLLKSTNSGTSWTVLASSLKDNYTYGLLFDAQKNLYLCGAGGIYKSTNETSWQSITSTMSNLDLFKVIVDPNAGKTIYVCSVSGVYKTTDGGANWNLMNNGIVDTDIWSLTMSPFSSTTLFAGSYGGLVYRTTDGGATWVEKSTGLTGMAGPDIWTLWAHPQNQNTFYAQEDGSRILATTNNGDSWTELKANNVSIKELMISNSNKSIWYSYSNAGGFYRSTDYGVSWTLQSTTTSLYNFAVDGNNSNTIYANQYSSPNYNIVRSTDAGVTWNTVFNNLYVRDLYSLPVSPYTLYAATWKGQGVMKSTDGGTSWTGLTTGLTYFSCFQVRNIPGSSAYIFVTTYGGSLYGLNYTPTSIEKDKNVTPTHYFLSPNYPNPFNPSTVISFSIPKSENVTLKIYDMLGREIVSLVNERMDAGSYKVNFNASNLASGVYLCHMTAGSFTQTQKMNFIK